jgi:hypothetical protein
MKSHLSLVAAAAIAAGSYAFMTTGLYAEDDTTTTAGQKVDRAADKTGDAVERAADRTGDAARNAADKTKDAVGSVDVKTEGATSGAAAGLPAGIQKATSDDSEDIRDVLAEVTEDALKKDGFEEMIGSFVDADRNRLGSFANQKDKLTTLNGRIAQIQKDFKAKYNKEFDIDHQVAFGSDFKSFQILQGEIVNPQLLTNWPVKASQSGSSSSSSSSSSSTGGASASARTGEAEVQVDVKNDGKIDKPVVGELGKPSNKPGDRNLDKGRNVAILHFPASHGMPALTVSMIHELPDSWKIDVPDNVDGQRLHDQLLNHLTQFGEAKDQWPADVNEAHRLAAHHVLAAIYDVNAPAKGAAGATGGGAASGTSSGSSSSSSSSSSTPK